MLLHVRSIAVHIAVICFFVLSFVGWISGLSLLVCCKRALIGAAVAYIAGGWAVKAVNAILIHAMIENQVDQQEHPPFAANRNLTSEDRRRGGTN